MGIICLLKPRRYLASFRIKEPCKFWGWEIFRKLEEGVELTSRVWYPKKVIRIRHNLFAGTETLSLSVYEPIAIQILHGGPSPIWKERVELGGQVWVPVKAHHNGHNLSIEINTLSPIRYLASFRS